MSEQALQARAESLAVSLERCDATTHYDAMIVRELIARVAELEARINAHNHGCQSLCGFGELEALSCGYQPYLLASGRRCPECPVEHKLEMP